MHERGLRTNFSLTWLPSFLEETNRKYGTVELQLVGCIISWKVGWFLQYLRPKCPKPTVIRNSL